MILNYTIGCSKNPNEYGIDIAPVQKTCLLGTDTVLIIVFGHGFWSNVRSFPVVVIKSGVKLIIILIVAFCFSVAFSSR